MFREIGITFSYWYSISIVLSNIFENPSSLFITFEPQFRSNSESVSSLYSFIWGMNEDVLFPAFQCIALPPLQNRWTTLLYLLKEACTKTFFALRYPLIFCCPFSTKNQLVLGDDAKMTGEHMSNLFIESMDTAFEKWTPREKYTLDVV